jgi:vancomycin permeability regulator SanA
MDGVHAPVALVLGAGLQGDGTPAPFLAQRVAVGADLYRSGQVSALLMSGDNSRQGYDEVTAMSLAAMRLGVPASAIALDYAGFDTYSSCYRARSVFGVRKAVVVSQPFHLPRAVWTCQALGVEVVGASTVADHSPTTARGWVREVPAVAKAMVDVTRGRQPLFAGPREHVLDAVTGS